MALFHTKGKCIVQLFDYVFCVFEFATIRGILNILYQQS